ncbi:hypothetical protein EDC45_0370 [Mesocricetibacter intestinalis]|uniref:Uncharacterized protein n=1 Tax=Mesocricetibacter intestinalis TaxID=1521930 RepID=A0A4R6VFR6_9PAST|nr:hypothetical protein [Mesocricetibacter intestinalis]TDQ59712.1 hypothetical protein EDC45_0370 [Mesocricetibacter intestinalis]
MSEQNQTKFLTGFFSALPLVIFLLIDVFALYLQAHSKALSHLAFAVLSAQLLCILVFLKGDICNGQRARLLKANRYFLIYWLCWFLLSFFSTYHYILTDIISLCGILMFLCINKPPQDIQMRRSMLIVAALIGALGILSYLIMLVRLPLSDWLQYNPVAQLLAGTVLANIMLVVARNRLQGFIALLCLSQGGLLFLNALCVLALLAVAYFNQTLAIANQAALILYFVLHIFISFMPAQAVFRNKALSYNSLLIVLTLCASLPLWATFAYIGA